MHIAFDADDTLWALDHVDHRGAAEEGFWTIEDMSQLPAVLEQITAQGWKPPGPRG